MRIQTDTSLTAATITNTAAKTSSAADFQAIYNSKVQQLWNDFAETGLTAADQALKKAGGEEALDIKKEREKQKKDSEQVQTAATETIRKYMPDGSLLIITTKNGKTVEQYRKKPHMTEVPDLANTPPKDLTGAVTNRIKMKQIPKRNLLED